MRRLFIGLMPGFAVQRQLSDHQSRWIWPTQARVTPPEKLHLTLHFLGQVDDEAQARLINALSTVRHGSFAMGLSEHGTFMPGGIAWMGPTPSPQLESLRAATGVAVRSAHLQPVPDWTPHVTLARHAGNVAFPQQGEPLLWHVDRFALVWSTEGKYVELESWPLELLDQAAAF